MQGVGLFSSSRQLKPRSVGAFCCQVNSAPTRRFCPDGRCIYAVSNFMLAQVKPVQVTVMAKTKVIRRRVIEDAGVQRPGWEHVGRYMYCFGQLEQALGDLLHHSLRLSRTAARLLLPRVMYAAKLDLIEAIIPLLKQPESWKSKAKQIVQDCKKFIDERNMFCHGAFTREMSGIIRFEYMSMKGKGPAVPSWSDATFEARCGELERLERDVSSLYPGFRPTTYVLRVESAKIHVKPLAASQRLTKKSGR
jgi:hypothetical protein